MTNQNKQLRLFEVKPIKPIKPKNMNIYFAELKIKLSSPDIYETREGVTIETDRIAKVSLTLIDDQKRHFTVNGFSIRKKRTGGLRLVGPWKKEGQGGRESFFPYTEIDDSLWRMIEEEVLLQYQCEQFLNCKEIEN